MRELIEKTWGWDEKWQRDDLTRRLRECQVRVIEVDRKDAGALWTQTTHDSTCIVDLQIVPALQRRGIGTAVLERLISDANADGRTMSLSVLHDNPEALRLYERFGFRVTARERPFIRMRWESRQRGHRDANT